MKTLYEPTAVDEPKPKAVPWKAGSASMQHTWQILPLAMVAAGILACNLAIVPLMELFGPNDWGAPFVYLCFGIIPFQFLALSAYLAWGTGPFWRRLTLHWAAAAVAFVVYVSGLIVSGNASELDEVVKYSPLVLAVSVAIQVPLWAMRFGLGWRLERVEANDQLAPERSLAIRDLMTGTLIVAVVLAAIRASPDPDVSNDWALVGLIVAGALAASTFVWLPVAWWMSAPRRPWLGTLLTALYAGVAVPVVWTCVFLVDRSSSRDTWAMLGVAVSILAHGAMLIAAGWAAHFAGWRLVTQRRAVLRADLAV